MSTATANRRRYSRLPFEGRARLQQSGQHHACEIVDISLRGILLRTPAGVTLHVGEAFDVEVILGDDTLVIGMQARVVHVRDEHVGFACDRMDVDSFAHLRRLLELNLGDPARLDRELDAMIHDRLATPPRA